MKLRSVRAILSHACIVAGLMVLVFFIADRFNPAMEFMTSEMSKWFILALAAMSFANAVLTISGIRHAIRRRTEKHPAESPARAAGFEKPEKTVETAEAAVKREEAGECESPIPSDGPEDKPAAIAGAE